MRYFDPEAMPSARTRISESPQRLAGEPNMGHGVNQAPNTLIFKAFIS
jgi:hypothetical protein